MRLRRWTALETGHRIRRVRRGTIYPMDPSQHRRLNYGRQSIDASDIDAVSATLRSDWLTQGPAIDEFEKAFAEKVGAQFAVTVSNGTAALHLSCLALDMAPGDVLVTSPITFLASANCALYCGGDAAFCDVTDGVPLMDAGALERTIVDLKRMGRKPKAVAPVHFAGYCCDMEKISAIAREQGLHIIEDGCHALGAAWRGAGGEEQRVGACSHGGMTVFSFHPVKQMTTGEGGMITTNSEALYRKVRSLRTHGVFRPEAGLGVDPWVYEMRELGFNYRLTDMQASLGTSQLKRLDQWVARRRAIVERYRDELNIPGRCHMLPELPRQSSSYHLAVLRLEGDDAESARRKLFHGLVEKNIHPQVHYIPVYRQPFYQRRYGYEAERFPNAEAFYSSCISLPLYPELADEDLERVIEAVKALLA